mmetsp:Transcript_38261/g.89884  ORF Transcript_38261/g.89884 Transcript_38261/m.89884 type:complete len:232 (-) Transcript_38261:579-1274(-)
MILSVCVASPPLRARKCQEQVRTILTVTSETAWSRAFMQVHLQVLRLQSFGKLKLAVLNVDVLQQGGDQVLSFLVGGGVGHADAKHQRVRRLLLLQTFEKFGTTATEAELGACLLGDVLHVLALLTKQSSAYSEAALLFNANDVLALALRAASSTTSSLAARLATALAGGLALAFPFRCVRGLLVLPASSRPPCLSMTLRLTVGLAGRAPLGLSAVSTVVVVVGRCRRCCF